MTGWQFAAENPIIAIILAYIACSPIRYAFRAYNRHCRAKNIASKGWPPEHLDADGDFAKDKT